MDACKRDNGLCVRKYQCEKRDKMILVSKNTNEQIAVKSKNCERNQFES